MSAGLSLWASLLAFARDGGRIADRRLLAIAIASAVILGTLRLTGPLFILLILASVAGLHWRSFTAGVRRNRAMLSVGAVLVAASVAVFAWWTFGPYVLDASGEGPDGPTSFHLGNLVLWPLQSVAAFPYRDQMGSLVVYPVVGALVIASVIVALRAGTRRERTVLLASMLTALVLPVILTLLTLQSTGVVWQGRYGLPYAVGFVLIAGVILGRHAARTTLPWSLTIPALTGYVVAIVACLLKVRDTELSDNVASASDPVWHEPGVGVLGVLVVLTMTLFAIALSGLARLRAEAPAPGTPHLHSRNA
jgi:hypothetical protein